MFNPFKQSQSRKPFLSPLGRRRALPAVAAPLAVTAVGGIALVVAFGALFGGLADRAGQPPASGPAAAPAVERQATAAPEAAPRQDGPVAEQAAEQAAGAAPAAIAAPRPPIVADTGTQAGPDLDSTAAIPPALGRARPDLAPDVPVAETEDDVAALEAIQSREIADDLGAAGEAEDTAGDGPATAQASAATPALKPATVNSAVNLRASPDNDAEVLVVVPGKAAIEAEADCGWCAATYQGRSGFIYKSFIDYR